MRMDDLPRGQALRLAAMSEDEQRTFILSMDPADALRLDAMFETWAQAGQIAPGGEHWRSWLLMAGRGFGKTRAGAEWVTRLAMSAPGRRIALVGATIDEARSIMVEGRSGLLFVARRFGLRVKWEPSAGRLRWRNGSEAVLFSGESPDGLRGPEHHFAWVLTFEVEADEEAVEPAFVLADASGGAIVANTASTPKLAGYAAHGSDRLSALRPIIETLGIALCDEAGKLADAPDRQPILAERELGCALGRDEHPAVQWSRQAEADAPRSVAIDFYDTGRDYQAGRVCVSAGAGGATDEQFELPVALAPEDAKSVATNLIARRWAEAETLTLRLPPTRTGIAPGTELVLSDRGRWRVQAVTIEGFAVVVEARRAVASLPTVPVDGGRQVFQADIAVARTRLGLFEVPQVDGHNRLMVAASSAGGFKPVPIELRVDGVQIGAVSATRAARLGRSAEYLAASSTPDDTMVVELVNPAQILFNADAQALAVGANRAMLGREMIQFATAEDLGFGRFRLSGLVRGCRGTQWAVAAHEAGTPFCLVDGLAMVPVATEDNLVGKTIVATAYGVGDQDPYPAAQILLVGDSMSDIPPVEVALPQGGDVVDDEARSTIEAILAVLSANGLTVA